MKKHTTQKGFTLIELIVSIFIFLLVMLAVVTVFARHIEAFQHNRVVQRNVENAQFAMGFIAKTLRTSSIVGDYSIPDTQELFAYDHSAQRCYHFAFEALTDANVVQMTESPQIVIDPTFCSETVTYDGADPIVLTTGDVTGGFYVIATERESEILGTDAVIGRVTISTHVDDDNPHNDPKIVNLQTTVSLRDYPAELSF